MKTEDIDMQDDPDKPKNTTFKKALMKRYCKYITCHKNFSLDVRRMCVCVFDGENASGYCKSMPSTPIHKHCILSQTQL